MDSYVLCLVLILAACLWSLLAPVTPPDTRPDVEALALRQRQIDRANHLEML